MAIRADQHPKWRLSNLANAALLTTLTASVYLYGSNTNFSHDEGTNVAFNIADRPWIEAFQAGASYNNHPLNSILAQAVWRLGGQSEIALRAIPILAGAVVVGLVYFAVSERISAAAGLTAALLIATNPMFIDLSRSVRGYSLMVCGVTASTIAFAEILRREGAAIAVPTSLLIAYAVPMGLGIGAHAYGGLAVIAHFLYLQRSGLPLRPWLTRIGASLVLGGALYALLLGELVRGRGRMFRPSIPLDTLVALGGGSALTALPLGLLAIWSFRSYGNRNALLQTCGILAALLGFVWLVAAPLDLFPRFFVALLPPLAVAVANALSPLGWKSPLAVLPLIALSLMPLIGSWKSEDLPNREAALLASQVSAEGGVACGLGWTALSLQAYTNVVDPKYSVSEMTQCDLVIGQNNRLPEAIKTLSEAFAHRGQIGSENTMLLFWNDAAAPVVNASEMVVSES